MTIINQELTRLADRMDRALERIKKHQGLSDKESFLDRAYEALSEINTDFEKIILNIKK